VVFGTPDERWGQRVCAAVVPQAHPGPAPSPARGQQLVEALAAQASARLAGYKRPKQWVVLDELPRTATGKVQRHRIAARPEP
jgi:acyl-CoA synthetase (AMP-forming)/AMP-acid ligase II